MSLRSRIDRLFAQLPRPKIPLLEYQLTDEEFQTVGRRLVYELGQSAGPQVGRTEADTKNVRVLYHRHWALICAWLGAF